jgi:hypothetical protein
MTSNPILISAAAEAEQRRPDAQIYTLRLELSFRIATTIICIADAMIEDRIVYVAAVGREQESISFLQELAQRLETDERILFNIEIAERRGQLDEVPLGLIARRNLTLTLTGTLVLCMNMGLLIEHCWGSAAHAGAIEFASRVVESLRRDGWPAHAAFVHESVIEGNEYDEEAEIDAMGFGLEDD